MLAKKRIKQRFFLLASLLIAGIATYLSHSVLLTAFVASQYAAFSLLYLVGSKMLFENTKNKKSLFFLFLAKSFLTFAPFILIGIFYREKLLWALFSYILVLLIFFISIKNDE